MKSSHPNRPSPIVPTSLVDSQELSPSAAADIPQSKHLAGSFNDELLVRGILTRAIRNCPRSREVIAEEMTTLMGSSVSPRALDSYTSESAQQNRFPLQYARAFCEVTGDYDLLRCVCERAGLHAISDADYELLELGREYLRQKRAQTAIAAIEQRLSGVKL